MQAMAAGNLTDIVADLGDLFRITLGEVLPSFARQARDIVHPIWIKLTAAIFVQKTPPVDLAAIGKSPELAFEAIQFFVHLIELIHQAINTIGIQLDLINQLDNLIACIFILRIELLIDRPVVLCTVKPPFLQLAKAPISFSNCIEGCDNAVFD